MVLVYISIYYIVLLDVSANGCYALSYISSYGASSLNLQFVTFYGYVSTVWKTSRVTPIPKNGSRSKVENYRPVAVLSAPGRVSESILNRHITRQVQTQLNDSQHGFRAGKSTAN